MNNNNNKSFDVLVTDKDRIDFSKISGDKNPLHVNDKYASKTEYRKCILHGAFSAGLVSKLAGMYLPGEKCVLLNMKLIIFLLDSNIDYHHDDYHLKIYHIIHNYFLLILV